MFKGKFPLIIFPDVESLNQIDYATIQNYHVFL